LYRKNSFKDEILSLPVPARLSHSGGRSGGALFHFAQDDNELGVDRQLMGAGLAALPPTQPPSTVYLHLTHCHSERNEMKRKNLNLKIFISDNNFFNF